MHTANSPIEKIMNGGSFSTIYLRATALDAFALATIHAQGYEK